MELIIFDAEGVIIDTESLWDREGETFLGRRGIAYDRDQIKHHLTGRSVVESTAVLKDMFGLKGSSEDLAKERIEIMKILLKTELKFIPGFIDFHETVSKKFKVCVATAMDKELLEIADRNLDLFGLFGGNIFSVADVNGVGKPEPDLFLHAASSMGSEPGKCIVIEDSPTGIEASKRAGMKCIGITTTYKAEKLGDASIVVRSFDEIDLEKIGCNE
ncbi:MAG: HAD family phosphatase [Nanoarchaeota archaeon]|nr:HAD family phosphatase [Nanoarchaeota archaeon]